MSKSKTLPCIGRYAQASTGFATDKTVYDFTVYDSYVKWAARTMVAVLQT